MDLLQTSLVKSHAGRQHERRRRNVGDCLHGVNVPEGHPLNNGPKAAQHSVEGPRPLLEGQGTATAGWATSLQAPCTAGATRAGEEQAPLTAAGAGALRDLAPRGVGRAASRTADRAAGRPFAVGSAVGLAGCMRAHVDGRRASSSHDLLARRRRCFPDDHLLKEGSSTPRRNALPSRLRRRRSHGLPDAPGAGRPPTLSRTS
mmetsp:Transcript_29962/g.94497  ORF Transcript_29962/g.94497 Transcript_29962/m.94497 type:complete len:203 (-) Transcript_29962:1-609(-)